MIHVARGCTVLVVALAAAFTAGPCADAAGMGDGPLATARTVVCKSPRVPVTVGAKTTCKPIAKAFPTPKEIDIRLVHVQAALKFAPPRRGRRGKVVRGLRSGFGAAGRKAQRKFLQVLPQALSQVDQSRAAAPSGASSGLTLARASAGCNPPPVTIIGSSSGVRIGGGFGDGAESGSMEYTARGRTFRVTFVTCRGRGLSVPECPAASGDVNASGGDRHFEVTTEVRDGERVLHRQLSVFDETLSAHGKVADDARLDHIDVDSSLETFLVASGGIVLRGTTVHRVRVDMRSGRYDPAGASVTTMGDRLQGATDAIASRIDSAIKAFREAETGGGILHKDGWATFDRTQGSYCAEPEFSPPSHTLRLRRGDRRSVDVFARARQDGGRAAGARWTLLSPVNAEFSPSSSRNAAPTFDYEVRAAPAGQEVRVTVRVTSTAGVGEKTWTQDTASDAIKHISGGFSGSYTLATFLGDSVFSFSGSLAFDRMTPAILGGAEGLYGFSGGDYTLVASGIDSTGATGCHQTGRRHFTLAADNTGSMTVTSTPPDFVAPYQYGFQVSPSIETMTITRINCPPGAESMENTTGEIGMMDDFTTTGEHISQDGVTYADSEIASYAGATSRMSWTLQGTE